MTNATPFALWKTICQGLLYIFYLQAFNWGNWKITILSITGLPTNNKTCSGFWEKCRASFGFPSEPLTIGQGLDTMYFTAAQYKNRRSPQVRGEQAKIPDVAVSALEICS